jgi:hypothetical protein
VITPGKHAAEQYGINTFNTVYPEGDMRPDWVVDIAGIRSTRREQVRSAGQYRALIEWRAI